MSELPRRFIAPPQEAPNYKYAGRHADSVMIDHAILTAARQHSESTGEPFTVAIEGATYRFTGMPDEPLETLYLVPYYEKNSSLDTRKDQLNSTVARWFGIAKENLNVARTCNEIDHELTAFVDGYAMAQRHRPFSLSKPYPEMTAAERKLVERGCMLTGHIISRLGRDGNLILSGGDTKGLRALEDIQELILRWSDQPQEDLAALEHMKKPARDTLRRDLVIKDFNHWIDVLTKQYDPGEDTVLRYKDADGVEKTFPSDELMRCVITHKKLRDHDGTLSYLAHEIRKVMTDELFIIEQERMAHTDPAHFAPLPRKEQLEIHRDIERMTMDGIVTYLGHTCKAIDEAYLAMCDIADHPRFQSFLRFAKPAPEQIDEARHDASHYRTLLRGYAEAARKRCTISSKDADNFDAAALECTHIAEELRWLHNDLSNTLNHASGRCFKPGEKLRLRESLKLLERGVTIIESMAEERIPRNANAPEAYDKHLPEYAGRDPSSVGRLKENIGRWVSEMDDSAKRAR